MRGAQRSASCALFAELRPGGVLEISELRGQPGDVDCGPGNFMAAWQFVKGDEMGPPKSKRKDHENALRLDFHGRPSYEEHPFGATVGSKACAARGHEHDVSKRNVNYKVTHDP